MSSFSQEGYGYIKTNQVPKYWIDRYEKGASKYWDSFYKSNGTNFFKDRHWILREFPELDPNPSSSTLSLSESPSSPHSVGVGSEESKESNENSDRKKKGKPLEIKERIEGKAIYLMEVGCGVGNTIFPLLEDNQNLFIYAFDFAPKAIQLVQQNPNYYPGRCKAFVCDITKQDITDDQVEDNSLDYITMFFILSAVSPPAMSDAVSRLFRKLKPNGKILFRDYAVEDMAQLRFEEERSDKDPNKLGDNFYVRKDGTRSYFFSLEFLAKLFGDAGFVVEDNQYTFRYVENIKEEKQMNRKFIQSRFLKPS